MKSLWVLVIFSCLANFVETKKLQKSFEEIFGDGWHLKKMGEEGKVNLAQIMAQENEQQQKRSGEGQSNHRMIKESDQNKEEENEDNDQQQKREIIRKFRQIKEKIKQKKGKQPRKEWNKIERTITKKLGTNRTKIYKWIRELGMGQKTMQTDEGRMALMRQYWEMKQNDPKISDKKIAKALKVSYRSMQRWKAQFEELEMKMKRQLIITDKQKREIVREFQTTIQKIKQKQGKQSRGEWKKIETLLAKKLGTHRDNIYKWTKKLGMGQKLTNEDKLALMSQYWEMKRNDPKMSDRKIAKALKVSYRSMQRWKAQFEELEMKMKYQLIITDEQKRKIVRTFQTIKERMKQRKGKQSRGKWKRIDSLLAKKLGTYRDNIYKWTKKLGMGQKLTNEDKLALMSQYWEMKRNDPKMSDRKIAKAMKVSESSIRKWKDQFGVE